MSLPFTERQFLEVFRMFNEAIWPLQVIAICVAALVIFLSLLRRGSPSREVLVSLAVMWVVNGIGYHWVFFSPINPAAFAFGGLFVVQAVLFAIYAGKYNGRILALDDSRSLLGLIIASYALIVYPILGAFLGHGYPYMPMIGVAPCPTTIFTLGVLLMARPRISGWALVIPILWSAIGSMAAWRLGVLEDLGMTASAIIVVISLALDRRNSLRAHHGNPNVRLHA